MPALLIPLIAGVGGFGVGAFSSSKVGSALQVLGFALAVFLVIILLQRL